nr:RNB domain-containing ribonuclease [Sinomonas mesophila]
MRAEFGLEDGYPEAAVADAERAIAALELPKADLTGIGFVTIDPPTSTDLDQALHIERDGGGYRVRYAIADVPAFVEPGTALDAETRRRGQTIYAADGKVPLHPAQISDSAGSLLADQVRSAFVWDFRLAPDGEVAGVGLERARVRSRAKLSYARAQEQIDAGTAVETLVLLREVGLLRIRLEAARGGASLNLPDQEIITADGGYGIEASPSRPVEDWNAQISLMTGMAAAQLMLAGGTGILRTMPEPDERSLRHFRRQTSALGKPWDDDVPYGQYLRTLDASDPRQLAILHAAGALFRGAGYTPFDGLPPAATAQAAIGAPYAHTTAPLRRLVDRFVLVICHAHANGHEVPGWARAALPELPAIMAASDQLAGRVERASLDLVEAALLVNRVGQEFDAVVVSGSIPADEEEDGGGRDGAPDGEPVTGTRGARRPQQESPLDRIASSQNGAGSEGTAEKPSGARPRPFGTIQLAEPPVTARCDGDMVSGTTVRVRLVEADVMARRILFERA